jgi:hypothetical protein
MSTNIGYKVANDFDFGRDICVFEQNRRERRQPCPVLGFKQPKKKSKKAPSCRFDSAAWCRLVLPLDGNMLVPPGAVRTIVGGTLEQSNTADSVDTAKALTAAWKDHHHLPTLARRPARCALWNNVPNDTRSSELRNAVPTNPYPRLSITAEPETAISAVPPAGGCIVFVSCITIAAIATAIGAASRIGSHSSEACN